MLEVDGQTLAQSNAINRYVGKLADLYPTDAWQAALCDEVMGAVEDISTKLAATLFLSDEEKKAQRTVLVDGPMAVTPLHIRVFVSARQEASTQIQSWPGLH